MLPSIRHKLVFTAIAIFFAFTSYSKNVSTGENSSIVDGKHRKSSSSPARVRDRMSTLNVTVSSFQIVEINVENYNNLSQWSLHAQTEAKSTDFSILVTFRAFNRTFRVHLYETYSSILSTDLVIAILNSSGKKILRRNDLKVVFFTGYLLDRPLSSFVHGSLQNGQFDFVIKMHNQSYFVESTSRYHDPQVVPFGRNTVAVYRNSDILPLKSTNGSSSDFCFLRNAPPFKRTEENWKRNDGNRTRFQKNSRSRRLFANPARKCCLALVVDHTFFRYIGLLNVDRTVSEIVYHIMEAEIVFKSTDFDGDFKGDDIGFTIDAIKIFESVDAPQYNMRQVDKDAVSLLEHFARYNFNDYCLAILFTFREFSNGVVGLSYLSSVGGPDDLPVGGICQTRSYQLLDEGLQPQLYNLNTLLITQLTYGRVINRNIVSHIVIHELGHSFGAMHDDALPMVDCKPADSASDGYYIMNSRAPKKEKLLINNYRFSPCSKAYIARSVEKWAPACFKDQPFPVCGNLIVESGEKCDCGNELRCALADPCCRPPTATGAKGKPGCVYFEERGSVCSPQTGLCCSSDCKPISSGVSAVCRQATECSEKSVCDGTSASCPLPQFKPLNTSCAEGQGHCLSGGTCSKSICALNNLSDCQCKFTFTALCKVCCGCPNQANSACLPAEWLGLTGSSLFGAPLVGDESIYKIPGSGCNGDSGTCNADNICVSSQ